MSKRTFHNRTYIDLSFPQAILTKEHTYKTPNDNNYPSVTTILRDTKPEADNASLQGWRDRMDNRYGTGVTKYIMETSSIIGTSVHKANELYLKGQPVPKGKLLAEAHHKNFIPYLDKIDNIYGCEVILFSEKMAIGGTADVIADYKGVPSIIDFKTKRSTQRESYIYDYKLQCAAYSLMFEELSNVRIDNYAILCSTEYNTFHAFTGEIGDNRELFLERLAQYDNMNGEK